MSGALWLFYLGGVVGDLKTTLGLLGGLSLPIYGAWHFCRFMEESGTLPPKWLPGLGVSLIFLAIILPSPSVLYAAAALNMGQEAIHTPTGDKAVRALNAWLDRQIAGEDEDK